MPHVRHLAAGLVLLVSGSMAVASRPMLPTLQREADAEGRTYVLVQTLGDFRIVRRDATLAAVSAEIAWNAEAAQRLRPAPGDTVLARGKLRQAPLEMRVRPDGAGFVALGNRFRNSRWTPQVTIVDRDGHVTAALTGEDLFVEPGATPVPDAEDWFVVSSWLTRDGRTLVSFGCRLGRGIERAVRRVDLASASVTTGTTSDVARALASPHTPTRREAFAAADFLGTSPLAGALQRLRDDRAAPLGLRACAALELAERGERPARRLTRRALALPRPDGVTEDDRKKLIRGLPHVLGRDALGPLRELIGSADAGDWYAAQSGLRAVGDDAVSVLAEILRLDPRTRARCGAAYALGRSYRREALGALLGAAAHDRDPQVVSQALTAAHWLVDQDVGPYLSGLLRRGTRADWKIIVLLERVKSPETIPLLIDRLRVETERPMPIINALRFQTREDLGEDPAAWQRWWDAR